MSEIAGTKVSLKDKDVNEQIQKAMEKAQADEKRFLDKFMGMNRKQRRATAKSSNFKWKDLPKFTKAMADEKSKILRGVKAWHTIKRQ